MTRKSSRRPPPGVVLALTLALAAAGCSTDGQEVATADATGGPSATYDCGEAGSIVIENGRSRIRITPAGGDVIELAAAPDSAGARYIGDGLAVVLEGREALIMRNGAEPVSCMR